MGMSEPEKTGEGVKAKVAELRERLNSDPQLREAMEADPKPMLEKELGISFPPDVDSETLRASLPRFFTIEVASSDELSDQELDAVSGTGCWYVKLGCACYNPFG
jgi:hypothetical protein